MTRDTQLDKLLAQLEHLGGERAKAEANTTKAAASVKIGASAEIMRALSDAIDAEEKVEKARSVVLNQIKEHVAALVASGLTS
jgi:hypothetical protein